MNVKKNFEKNNFRVLKSDAKVDATIIFVATINTAPTVLVARVWIVLVGRYGT
jgi:hypothetical protein